MDWANVTKIHTPLSAKRYSPPCRACAVQRQFCDREWRAIESQRDSREFGDVGFCG